MVDWVGLFQGIHSIRLQDGCGPGQISEAEGAMGRPLPEALRDMLLATDGVHDALGFDYGWSLAKIVEVNRRTWRTIRADSTAT